ncbi:MAG: PIG-L family deacetylase [Acidimicrobiaceae bacterium]|nr:PIG-L family deacetylase [Acidimicrobiaceae bacterium]
MGDQAAPALAPLPEDWSRALAVVAHPDDLEYGASAAVARWSAMGKDVRYVLATRGEAGIDSMPPEQTGPLRTAEQVAAAAAVGVSVVEFLDHPDGLVVNGLELRRDLAAAIRRHRPEVIIGSNFRDRWGETGPWNHVDHRELGRALPDAVRDAANRWLFTDAGEPWSGVRWVAFASSLASTHAVDVSGHIDEGVASLDCHRTYIDNLGDPDFDPDSFLRGSCQRVGEMAGVPFAVSFELVPV